MGKAARRAAAEREPDGRAIGSGRGGLRGGFRAAISVAWTAQGFEDQVRSSLAGR